MCSSIPPLQIEQQATITHNQIISAASRVLNKWKLYNSGLLCQEQTESHSGIIYSSAGLHQICHALTSCPYGVLTLACSLCHREATSSYKSLLHTSGECKWNKYMFMEFRLKQEIRDDCPHVWWWEDINYSGKLAAKCIRLQQMLWNPTGAQWRLSPITICQGDNVLHLSNNELSQIIYCIAEISSPVVDYTDELF